MASPLLFLLLLIPVLIGITLLFGPSRRLIRHCVEVLLNEKTPLRWLAGLLAGIIPPVTWTLAFKSARGLPDEWRPKIHTDILPRLEAKLLAPSGVLFLTVLLIPLALLIRARCHMDLSRRLYPVLIVVFPLWLRVLNVLALGVEWTPTQDVFAWIFYGVLHFASPFIAGWWVWGFGPPGAAIVFGITLGAQNLCGLFTHLVFPNAAPWFYDVYPAGTVPDYSFPGNPAGLIRVDAALGTHLYKAAFKKSPVVFGALPSLHAATAVCFSLFVACYGGNWGIAVMIFYTSAMFWSTMYLHHHFAVDLVAGSLYALIAFSVASHFLLRKLDAKHLEDGTTRGVDRLFCRAPRDQSYARIPSNPTSARVSSQLEDEEETAGVHVTSARNSLESAGPGRQSFTLADGRRLMATSIVPAAARSDARGKTKEAGRQVRPGSGGSGRRGSDAAAAHGY